MEVVLFVLTSGEETSRWNLYITFAVPVKLSRELEQQTKVTSSNLKTKLNFTQT